MIGTKASDLANAAYERGDKDEYEFWKEGGPGRAALHAIAGGLLGGVTDFSGMLSGVLGGASSALLAPKIRELVAEFVKESGLTGSAAEFMTNTVTGSILQGIGGVTGGAGAAYAGNAYQFNYLDHADSEKRVEAISACAQGDLSACEVAKALNEKDEKQQKEYVACRAGGYAGVGCEAVLKNAVVALSSYSGVASFMNDEDWNKVVRNPDIMGQMLKILAPDGYENLPREDQNAMYWAIRAITQDFTGVTAIPKIMQSASDGDPWALAQIVGIVAKLKGIGAVKEVVKGDEAATVGGVKPFKSTDTEYAKEIKSYPGHDTIDLTVIGQPKPFRRAELSANFTNGDLSINYYTSDVRGQQIGTELISNAIELAGAKNVRSVSGSFGKTNLEVYEKLISSGKTGTEAAWGTPLGKSMQALGFKTVEISHGALPGFKFGY
ncbi:DUF6862 domain-containing protein [Brucella pituitosa]